MYVHALQVVHNGRMCIVYVIYTHTRSENACISSVTILWISHINIVTKHICIYIPSFVFQLSVKSQPGIGRVSRSHYNVRVVYVHMYCI